MRDYKIRIGLEECNKLLSQLLNLGYEAYEHRGSLVDDYLIELGENNLKMGNVKFRKFLIIHEVYLNSNSSGLELILTDNEKLYREYEQYFYEDDLEYEKELEEHEAKSAQKKF